MWIYKLLILLALMASWMPDKSMAAASDESVRKISILFEEPEEEEEENEELAARN